MRRTLLSCTTAFTFSMIVCASPLTDSHHAVAAISHILLKTTRARRTPRHGHVRDSGSVGARRALHVLHQIPDTNRTMDESDAMGAWPIGAPRRSSHRRA